MKYIDKNTLAKIELLKKKKTRKQSIDKNKEMADRNSIDPNAGNNTRAQRSGMGEIANSHSKRVGNIMNKNAEKAIENIDKINNPDKKRELVKKKMHEINMEESITSELRKDPDVWNNVIVLWKKLAENDKVSLNDEFSFFSFQSFFRSFYKKNEKHPTYKDALKFANTN